MVHKLRLWRTLNVTTYVITAVKPKQNTVNQKEQFLRRGLLSTSFDHNNYNKSAMKVNMFVTI